MRRKLLAAAASFATLAALPFGHAQAADPYPNKPIELVVGYPAGGPTDVSARLIAQDLATGLGVPVVITNKVGAGSLIATQQVLRTKPDGYTFLFASLGHNINPLLMPDRAKYDPIKDFDLVTPVAVQPLVLVTAYDSKFSSLKELLAAARQAPESISYGSSGNGGVGHLGGELLAMQSGTKLLHVPFRGNSLALAEVMAGRISFMFYPSIGIAEQLASKRLKLLAIAPSNGLKDFPGAPTLASLGHPGFDDLAPWIGVIAPKGTPPEAIRLMSQKLNAVLANPVARKRIEDVGNSVTGGSPADFERQLASSTAAAEKVIKFANIKVD